MMQKIQKFGGAMFTPVLLFAFAGIVVGVGTLFTTEAIMGDLARPDSLFYQVWNVILQGGWTSCRCCSQSRFPSAWRKNRMPAAAWKHWYST